MAEHHFYAEASIEGGDRFCSISPTGSSGNRLKVVRGDTLVIHGSNAGNATVLVGGFTSTFFTVAGSLSLSPGQTATKTISATATLDGTFNLSASLTKATTRFAYLQVVSGIDTTPNAFDLGANLSNATPSSEYTSATVTIAGINSPTPVSITNGVFRVGTGGAWTTSTFINVGDRLTVKVSSSAAFGATVTATLNVGGVTDTFSVTNMADPASSGIGIPSGIVSPVSLLAVKAFFGGDGRLSSYLKYPGGSLVPSILGNENIPTALPLNLSNFAGAKTALYFSTYPKYKSASKDTTQAGGTLQVTWRLNTEYFMGYGAGIWSALEYKFSMTYDNPSNPINATLYSDAGIDVWSKLNTSVWVMASSGTYTEASVRGKVTIYARHPNSPSLVITAVVPFDIDFYGP